MRKIIVLQFMTLDGVVQAPGGPDEDTSSGFEYGGWVWPYSDEVSGKEIEGQMVGRSYDLLLGRKTYDIFANYWPQHDDNPIGKDFNRATKYVATRSSVEPTWQKTVVLTGDAAGAVKQLKADDGPELQVHGAETLCRRCSRTTSWTSCG